jgi:glutamate-5-semialdehyde dehydrogenase
MSAENDNDAAIARLMDDIGRAARVAAGELAAAGGAQRDAALHAAAKALRLNESDILAANRDDVGKARAAGLTAAMIDRLALDAAGIEAMAAGLEAIAAMRDPVGRVLAEWQRPNGLHIQRVSVPLGVIGIIYESRPNVTADAAGLCVKSGNAAILRGGSESTASSRAIYECMRAGLAAAGIDANAVQMVPTTDRAAVGYLLASMAGMVDVVVPRGGRSLVERVQREARVPVIGHLEGLCHVYVHHDADPDMAREIAVNAKMRRTGICGAAETILVDRDAAAAQLPGLAAALIDAGCTIRGDVEVCRLVPAAEAATEADWNTEYLDAIVSIAVVDGPEEAMAHIRRHGSGHTECIVTGDDDVAERFLAGVDSAIVLHNASTQFADGGEFGMGAEIGIATGRIHARGPVGAEQLTSFKYVVRGTGQTRA